MFNSFAYKHQYVIGISFSLSQSTPIQWPPLYHSTTSTFITSTTTTSTFCLKTSTVNNINWLKHRVPKTSILGNWLAQQIAIQHFLTMIFQVTASRKLSVWHWPTVITLSCYHCVWDEKPDNIKQIEKS